MLSFELLASDGQARRGRLTLRHGVGRDADLHAGRHLRHASRACRRVARGDGRRRSSSATPSTSGCGPGLDVHRAASAACTASRAGTRPILTDCGGFQVWSLGAMRKISEEGVAFAVAGQRRQAAPDARGQHADPARARQRHRRCSSTSARRTRSTAASRPRPRRARSMELSLRWARRCQRRVRAAREPERAVRHRPGRHVRAPARGIARGAGRARPARLRDRRRQRRRAEGRDAAHRRAHAAPAAGGQAALPDGRRHARGPGRRRRRRRRHVRLRDADAQRAQRPPVHALRRPADPQRPLQDRRAAARPDLRLPRPARASRAPTCTTSTAAARCSAPMLASVHNLHFYVEPDARHPRRARGRPLRRLRRRRFAPIARAASEAPSNGAASDVPYRRRRGPPTARRAVARLSHADAACLPLGAAGAAQRCATHAVLVIALFSD